MSEKIDLTKACVVHVHPICMMLCEGLLRPASRKEMPPYNNLQLC